MSKLNNPQKEFDRLERVVAAQQAQLCRLWDLLNSIKKIANPETSQAISAFMMHDKLGADIIQPEN